MPGVRTSDARKDDSGVRLKLWRFHAQNLSDKYVEGNHVGFTHRMWKHGRCWLNVGREVLKDHGLRVEWNVFSGRCSIGLQYGGWDDDVLQGHLSLLLFSIYVGLSWPGELAKRIQGKTRVEWGLSIHDGSLFWDMGGEWGHWSRADPWYKHGSINFLDTVFGRTQHHERVVKTTETEVPMKEGKYPCVVTLKDEWWTRKRTGQIVWHRRNGAHVEVQAKGGIPFPGKGENSWDCGMDGLCSSHCSATTTEEAVASVVESVLKSRRRHGGSVNWVPTEAV